jgi:hypothetical protein
MRMHTRATAVGLVGLCATSGALAARHAAAGQTATAPEVILTATSANVAEPGNQVTIQIFRWSTEAERTPLVAALNPPAASSVGEGRGATGRGGPAADGRGRGRGAAAAPEATPIEALGRGISRAPSIGYVWTTDATGYAIKYAFRAPLPDGSERIILATDRRLGAHTAAWQPVVSTPLTDYTFTLIEIRLDAKGRGEARTSLTTAVIVDKDAATVALEDYTGTPAILENVALQTPRR